ncbi:MAG: SDR family oxidoreductase, partial [Candidatus Binatia bacterium]|nr:SDR family oxidoreductase [Candidatus Binatia bacterium]
IGHACAAALAADGAQVMICGRTESSLVDSAGRARDKAGFGGDVQHRVCDVTDEDSVRETIESTASLTGTLDGVVANAGGGGMIAPFHMQEKDEFLRVLQLNVLGTMLCIKHAVPLMRDAGGGSFVGMSSLAGHVTHPLFGAYTAGKAGIEQMMRNAADEFGPAKIRFNSVRPGFIATEIMEGVPRDSEVFESYVKNTPLGDVGEPEDVGHLVRFLIGDQARWITGAAINIDGGQALRRGPDFSSFLRDAVGDEVLTGKKPG